MNNELGGIAGDRRHWLKTAACGFGWLALVGLEAETQRRAALSGDSSALGDEPMPKNGRPAEQNVEGQNSAERVAPGERRKPGPLGPHFAPRAKRVIFLFMDGGVSQVDSFDPKPRLKRENGEPFKAAIDPTQFANIGRTLASPWEFRRHGQAGIEISDLFPNIGRMADELCVVRSMTGQFPEHAQACYFLHTGHGLAGRPAVGAWASYGLGTDARDLPGFVVLNGGSLPLGGLPNYGSGFLPATHEGSLFNVGAQGPLIDNLVPAAGQAAQREQLEFLRGADERFGESLGAARGAVDAAIRNYELAAAMQTSVPDVADLRDESATTLRAYGVDSADPIQARYARECLLARRLVERGVRFIEVSCAGGIRFVSPWDQHEDLVEMHAKNARIVDQPIAALLADLKSRGLLDETLIVWGGEFGRTPFAQGSNGRDHNPQGYSIWLAGGGVRGGMTYGATDDYGYRAVENVVSMHDLHATILHLLGVDHERLTFFHGGRHYRLTDVHGRVVREILA
ncbi:MAG TPA: DUF1501 domain-containing protein [Pirellulaceae bacterium]|nr:DUF1501 domain-containing protein [Pirellulaceae bacterium]